ncbi:hypothetical protein [Mogibacterium timidum]|uniref:Uncharacterized protein n=2 Tax=Mogibacterium timidum TaxID=35519 RepID=X8IPI8_9FIRM|nr:hypothetical protein [Mogibacterium timidum]EUC52018.1 hypothetical protein HMPREF0581_0496 [Mogibacterium timidum ATCC 33093]NWO22491.1 hypothetical protein [Mogibacterium timidum]
MCNDKKKFFYTDFNLYYSIQSKSNCNGCGLCGHRRYQHRDGSIRDIGFSGEQFFPNAIGNSISVLYNNANNISINYRIVEHGTTNEQSVVLSFISSDIDTAQGVATDLANLVELIPESSNLAKQDGIIYDTTPGMVGLNGSRDLPRGGYLGAGFLSGFNYTFYMYLREKKSF